MSHSVEWIQNSSQKRDREREYELTELNFIEIQFDVDLVNIDPRSPDFSVFMVCDIRQ